MFFGQRYHDYLLAQLKSLVMIQITGTGFHLDTVLNILH
jgi:hypothetical protein